MGMTREERKAKAYLQRLLRTNGYPTYAKILEKFDVNYTSDPNAVAYMEPSTGRIVINRELDSRQASVIVRHEILHNYLKHEKRLLDSLARKRGLDRKELEGTALEDLDKELKRQLYRNSNFNIAADYEISNRGYTEKDKDDVRAIQIGGRIVSGLVTEDKHPDWTELSVEEMYDKIEQEMEDAKKNADMDDEDDYIKGLLVNPETFVDPFNKVVYNKKWAKNWAKVLGRA